MGKYKKVISICLCTVLIVAAGAFAGYNAFTKTTLNLSNSTIAGQVTAINGSRITLQLGTLSEAAGGMNGPTGLTSPNGSNGSSDNQKQKSDAVTSATQKSPSGNNNSSGNTPPDKPSGMPQIDGNMGSSGFMSGGSTATLVIRNEKLINIESSDGTTSGSLDDIKEGAILLITFGKNNSIKSIIIKSDSSSIDGNGGGNGSSTENNGTSATTLDSDTKAADKTYESTGDDENALRVENSASVALSGATISKTGGSTSSTENSDFYGLNAGVLARDGASLTISNSTITTNAAGGNGLFAYGNSTKVSLSDTKISTSLNNSGGIDASGGSTIDASNLTIDTQGNSSAAIRSDRGGGTITVDKGSYTTNGTGSPGIYSTADITVSNAQLTANNSEAVVVEGKNSVTLKDCIVTGNMSGTYADSNNENLHNVMLYQSMSGDADQGKSSFAMTGGSLISKSGDMFYVTNTSCTITLDNVSMTYANDKVLAVESNDSSRGWGAAGSNGGICEFTCTNQSLKGNITVDEISSLTLTMKEGSSLEGAINSEGAAGTVKLSLDSNSTWTLTGDSYITSFDGNADSINTNGYHIYVNGSLLK